MHQRKIKKSKKSITCIQTPKRSRQYAQRSPPPPTEPLFKEVSILHIHQVISSTAPNSFNKQFQKLRQTRKNHIRVNNSKHLGNSGPGWRWILFNQQQPMLIIQKEWMLITLRSRLVMSCWPIKQGHQGCRCADRSIPHRCKSQRRSQVELEEGSIWSWNSNHTTPSWS